MEVGGTHFILSIPRQSLEVYLQSLEAGISRHGNGIDREGAIRVEIALRKNNERPAYVEGDHRCDQRAQGGGKEEQTLAIRYSSQ